MFTGVEHEYLADVNGDFNIADLNQYGIEVADEKSLKKVLKKKQKYLGELQHKLYAENKQSLLVVFQAMDAAGKDSTIRHVFKGVNPTGCVVSSFKAPSKVELNHDFLWRTSKVMPEKGKIGVFNRSYYEEALVVRVHPEYLQGQKLPPDSLNNMDEFWHQRFESIASHEKHLVQNGTVVIKFWLNVSKEEQKNRFLSRLNEPEKHWKFSSGDVKERGYWNDYMHAYEQMIAATSKSHAPWYAIPADNKPYMRLCVANIIIETLEKMNPVFPEVSSKEQQSFDEMRQVLNTE